MSDLSDEIEAFKRRMADERLQAKYLVHKVDTGEPVDGCFVLRPDRDPAALAALEAYAQATPSVFLRFDLTNWLIELRREISEGEAEITGDGAGGVPHTFRSREDRPCAVGGGRVSDRPIHGGIEDVAADTERALRQQRDEARAEVERLREQVDHYERRLHRLTHKSVPRSRCDQCAAERAQERKAHRECATVPRGGEPYSHRVFLVFLRTAAIEALGRFPGQTISDRVLTVVSEVDTLRLQRSAWQAERGDWANALLAKDAEIERLQDLIGQLYMGRGGDRRELAQAIRRAFFSMRQDGES